MSTSRQYRCDQCRRVATAPDDDREDRPRGWWLIIAPCGFIGDACSPACATTMIDTHAKHDPSIHDAAIGTVRLS